MKTKKWTVLAALLLVVCLVFTSCTTDNPASSGSKEPGSNIQDETDNPSQTQEPTGDQAAAKADGVKMIVSVDSGKALESDNGTLITSTYTFLAKQTWQAEKD